MRALKSTTILFSLLGALAILGATASPAVAWAASGDDSSCAASLSSGPISSLVGCGDGICDPYMGENATTCPADCAPKVAIPTATPTRVITRTPTPTPTLTPTPTVSGTPTIVTIVPLLTPTQPGGGVGGFGCGFAAYESRVQAWQQAYQGAISPRGYMPVRADDQEVYVCSVPPVGQLCIPIYQGLLTAAQGNIENIALLDCSADGTCRTLNRAPQQLSDMLCYQITPTDQVTCMDGCALAPGRTSLLSLPFLGSLAPAEILVPVACLVVIGIVGVVLLLILASRRRKRGSSAGRA